MEIILEVLRIGFKVNNVAYIAPSVTPYHGGNPAYRLYKVGGEVHLRQGNFEIQHLLMLHSSKNIPLTRDVKGGS